eukprot:scaffold426_cov181-Pinguiococcus_pyrenoidosus.AAC.1
MDCRASYSFYGWNLLAKEALWERPGARIPVGASSSGFRRRRTSIIVNVDSGWWRSTAAPVVIVKLRCTDALTSALTSVTVKVKVFECALGESLIFQLSGLVYLVKVEAHASLAIAFVLILHQDGHLQDAPQQ